MAMTLIQVHAMIMILSFMTFGSVGIFISRYGRSIRFGPHKQLLGKAIWFQMHRFFLSISSLLILTGFLVILVRAGGQWVNPAILGMQKYIHSILGGIIVCCSITQIWLALYRCNPNSRFRYIFDWSHRAVGLLAFSLSIPTIFINLLSSRYFTAVITIMSLWTGWTLALIVICERIEHKKRISAQSIALNNHQHGRNHENMNTNMPPDIEAGVNTHAGGTQSHNQIKLLFLFLHFIICIILPMLLIVFLCK